jgi:hypothetical protein
MKFETRTNDMRLHGVILGSKYSAAKHERIVGATGQLRG